MEVQTRLKTFVLFTHCLAPTPMVQQEEEIKMGRADSHGNCFPQQHHHLYSVHVCKTGKGLIYLKRGGHLLLFDLTIR